MSLHLSGYARNLYDQDLIVLGGPVKNREAVRRLDGLRTDDDLPTFVFDDHTNRCLQIVNHDGRRFG